MALVYEYMHGGNLEDRLRGKLAPPSPPSERKQSPLGGGSFFSILLSIKIQIAMSTSYFKDLRKIKERTL